MRTLLCLLTSTLTTSVAAQGSLTGTWLGYWARSGDTMAVTLDVRRDSTGRHSSVFSADRLRVMGIPFTSVDLSGCCEVTMVLRGDRTTMKFAGRLHADSLTGAFEETEASAGTFAFSRKATALAVPTERDVTFANGDVTLAGSLLLPAGNSGPLAAVVFLHGSGAEGRWASLF